MGKLRAGGVVTGGCRGGVGRWLRVLVAVGCAGLAVPLAAGGAARAASSSQSPVAVGAAWQHPATGQSDGNLGSFSPGDPQLQAETASVARARASGQPVVVGSLTSGTQLVTAEPDGTLAATTSVLPVRVRERSGWVAVSTRLRAAHGRLVAAAVPGDSVSFSAGGRSVAAQITEGMSSLRLWWPGVLPSAVVSGSSATYRNVLPGVNLVLTAVSGQSGGFSEVLVVTSRAAARDRGLADLAWRVSVPGTSGLRTVAGGGVVARIGGLSGFAAAAPVMWDSSTVPLTASRAVVRAASASAKLAGAVLAPDGAGSVSTVSGPAQGAHEASVGVRVSGGGSGLSLVPAAALLSSSSTRFPVYVDPTFTSYDDTAGTDAFDSVQSESGCSGAHYHTDVTSTSDYPVGFNNFGAGSCSSDDTDYMLYQVDVPSGALASDAHLLAASLQVTEAYSSDCVSTATMTATWIGGMNSKTGWPGPGKTSGDENAQAKLGPDTYKDSSGNTVSSCNTVAVAGNAVTVSAGFNVAADLSRAGSSATDMTFRVWEDPSANTKDSAYPSQPSMVLHKQLTVDPTLEVHWIYSPRTPVDLLEAADGSGTSSLDCDTSSASPPRIGKTIAQGGVYLLADLDEPTDGSHAAPSIAYNVRYATGTSSSPSWTTVTGIQTVSNGADVYYKLPATVTSGSGVADGTIIQWQAQADIGTTSLGGTTYGPYTSDWTKSCFFAVYPDAPDAPDVKANFSETAGQTIGSKVTFTITQSSGDTASEFVWGLDEVPPTSDPPAGQTCGTSTAEADCTRIISGTATLTVTVPAPGPQDVWVYEVGSAGNVSGATNGAPPGQSNTFEGAADAGVMYDAPGADLQQNFDDAMDNTMISKAAGASDGAMADGLGNSFDEQELQDAGWIPGGTVTVDGATFQLPKFGQPASGSDNVLAAGQTISAGATGASGTSLMFLATSTHGVIAVPGSGSGASDSGPLAGDVTAPMVAGGYAVTGADCDLGGTFGDNAGCVPATGRVTYVSGCTVNNVTQTYTTYTLTAQDWVGAGDIAALTIPDRDTASGKDGSNPSIYVFSVPIVGSCKVASVQLPDIGADDGLPALHILGMTLRNTTTATPQAGGGEPVTPAATAWTGAFASAIDNAYAPPSGQAWGNQTIRIAVSPGVTAAASTAANPVDVRIRLSFPGWWSQDGTGPIKIGAASIAPQEADGSPAASAAPTALTFGGSASVTIQEGGDIYSDPVSLPFKVAPGDGILVSLYLANSSLPVLPLNNNTGGAQTWFAPSSTSDETSDQAGTPFTGSGGYLTDSVPVLTGVDVTTPAITSVSPGEPTVVVTGDDGIIDGNYMPLPSDAADDPGQRLAGQLVSQGDASGDGVVDTSVENNMILWDAYPPGPDPLDGLTLQARLDHDVLAEPDLGTVILNIGLEDVIWEDGVSTVMTPVENVIRGIVNMLYDNGLVTGGHFGGVTVASLTPCYGFDDNTLVLTCDASAESGRDSINNSLTAIEDMSCEADFDAAVAAVPGTDPETLATADSVDGANLTLGSSGGYAKLAAPAAACGFAAPPDPLPPAP